MSTKIKEKFTYGYNSEQFKKFKKYAWLMLLSFSLMYLFFYNGRQNINLVKTDMAAAFGFFKDGNPDVAPIGVISSALFWCYAFGQLVSGRIGSFFGYKKVMCAGVIGSAALNVAFSFIPVEQDYMWLFAVVWGLNGFFQAMVWSNGVGVINKWWPKEKRGFASGLATSFSGLAQVVTYYTIFLVTKTDLNLGWGWQAAFRFPMIPMLLILVAFIFFFKTKPEDVGLAPFVEKDQAASERDAKLSSELSQKGFLYPYKVLFSEAKVIVFCLISAIAGIGRYALLSLVPTYFDEKMDLDFGDSITKIVLLPLGQACAMFVFPFITDKVFKGKREPMLILASIVTFAVMLTFPFINNPTLASIMLFVVGVSGMVTGVIWAIAGDMGGRAFAAVVVGVLDWAVYMGAAIQETSFGYLKNTVYDIAFDMTKNEAISKTAGWAAIFILIGLLYVIMLVLTLLARKMKTKKI